MKPPNRPFDFTGATALIVGGASGLGGATARRLAAKGVRVAIFDFNDQAGAAMAREINGVFCKVDVTSEEQLVAGFAKARAAHGQERILVNCAGTGNAFKTASRDKATGEPKHFPLKEFEKIIQINLIGTFRCIAHSAAGMLTLDPVGQHGERGAIVNTASVAAQDGSSRWITSEEARAHARRLRSTVDAVVVGAGTLRRDDPSLDVRIDGYDGPQPRPVVIAGRSPLPTERRIWSRDPVVVSSSEPDIPSGELLTVPGQEFPDPVETARALADLGYLHLLLEGGPTLAGAWWRAGLADRGVVYVGARMGGGNGRAPLDGFFASIDDAVELEFVHLESVGRDVVIEFEKKP